MCFFRLYSEVSPVVVYKQLCATLGRRLGVCVVCNDLCPGACPVSLIRWLSFFVMSLGQR